MTNARKTISNTFKNVLKERRIKQHTKKETIETQKDLDFMKNFDRDNPYKTATNEELDKLAQDLIETKEEIDRNIREGNYTDGGKAAMAFYEAIKNNLEKTLKKRNGEEEDE